MPRSVWLLLGLGFDSLSVAPGFLAEVKAAVRRTPADQARSLADEALAQGDCAGVREVLSRVRDRLMLET